MNFLAHIYLSGGREELTVGNFMADAIKGKDYEKYSGDLRKGILLHRKIDSFTDHHPLVQQGASRLFKNFRHYNSVIIDIFYDHFLAKNWRDYHTQDLADYVQNFYRLLARNIDKTPPNIQRLFPYMKTQNWLYSYRKIEGIEQILTQMNSRMQAPTNIQQAVRELEKYYGDYEAEFTAFFPQIIRYTDEEKRRLQ